MEVGVVILSIAGITTIIACVFVVRYQIKWTKEGKLVYGKILSCYISSYGSGNDSISYTKRVEYEIDGKRYEKEFNEGGKIKKGKIVPLLYKPEKPNEIYYRQKIRTYIGIALTSGVGIGCFIGAFDLIRTLLNDNNFLFLIIIGIVFFIISTLPLTANIKYLKKTQEADKSTPDGKEHSEIVLHTEQTDKTSQTNKTSVSTLSYNKQANTPTKADLIIKSCDSKLDIILPISNYIEDNMTFEEIRKMLDVLPVVFKIKFKNAEDREYLDNWFRDLLEDIKIEYEIIETI